MTKSRITTVIANVITLACVGFVFSFGIRYIVDPWGIAPTFGLHTWPTGDAASFLEVKGFRDVATGLVVLTLLIARQRFALGLSLLVLALIPIGDMFTLLRNSGSVATAFGVHGLTAAVMIGTAALILRERRTTAKPAATAIPVPA